MKKANKSTDTEAMEVTRRVVLPIQTRGNIGKSTEAIARAAWMDARGVQWQGFDLDAHNRTFSDNFPERAKLIDLSGSEPEGDVIRIFRQSAKADVTVIDPRAHMDEVILRALKLVQFPQTVAKDGIRLTVTIYPIDEITDLDNIANTVDALGDSVDWVIVRNPARQPRTRMFDGSELESTLTELGAATLTLPGLLTDTRTALRAYEARIGRAISPAEALNNPEIKIDTTHRMILEQWMREVYTAFDSIAPLLVPAQKGNEIRTAYKAAPKSEAPARRRGASINLANLE